MSSLNSLYIKTEILEQLLKTAQKKEMKGIEVTISINDDANTYGQNISAFVSQSKEDRDAKKPKYYIGNGKTFWTDVKIAVPPKEVPTVSEAKVVTEEDEDPF